MELLEKPKSGHFMAVNAPTSRNVPVRSVLLPSGGVVKVVRADILAKALKK